MTQCAHRVLIKGIWSLKGTPGSVVSLAMSDLFSSTKLQHRQILTHNSLPLQSHAHCLVRLVSTVRWASVGKKAERGVEGTGQAREGDFKVFTETTHTCVSSAKNKRPGPGPHHRAKARG